MGRTAANRPRFLPKEGPSFTCRGLRKSVLCGSIWMLCALTSGSAATITVTSATDSGAGSLRAALAAANPGDTIAFSLPANSTITLTSELPVISQNLTINGSGTTGLTISGNGGNRVFFVNSGTVSIQNLTIANGLALGGAGGNGGAGGGGGAGAGGAILVGSTASVSVQNVAFSGNAAQGGAGGASLGGGNGGGGGGGLGGAGGAGVNGGGSPVNSGGGGGGVGQNASGGTSSTGGAGSAGILVGSGPGGSSVGGIPGGSNAGGGSTAAPGGTFSSGGGGGANGTSSAGAGGAAGGFGGGGGGGVDIVGVSGYEGGNGGTFGGGGGGGLDDNGAAKFGGNGGLGGGGGGGLTPSQGGLGGGGSTGLAGGGGGGLGGAVFVMQGGSFIVTDGAFTSNTASGGAAGGAGASAGTGVGGALFLMGANVTYNISAGNTSTVDSSIADDTVDGLAGTLTKIGGGTLNLTAQNTYTGGTTIGAGTLALSGVGALSAIGAVAISANATFDISESTISQTIGDLTGSGTVALGGNQLTVGTTNTTNFSGVIQDGGIGGGIGGSLVKQGAGVFTLTGANTYTGGTIITAGTLALSGGGTLAATGSVTVNASGTFDISQSKISQIIGDLSGSGTVALGGNQLTVGTANSTTFSGVIQDAGSGGSLVKEGTGILTLTGTNTYTGGTTIGAGTLSISMDTNLGASAGLLTFDGGTLEITNSFTASRPVVMTSNNGTILTDLGVTLTENGVITGTGALTKTGAGTLVLSGANTYKGGTTISAGTLSISSDTNLGDDAGTLTLGGGALEATSSFTSPRSIVIAANTGTILTDSGVTLTTSGAISGTGALAKSGTGTLLLTGANTYTGGTLITAGTLALSGAGTLSSMGAVAVNAGAAFDISQSTLSQIIGDLSGSGTVALGGNQLTVGTANSTTFSGVIQDGAKGGSLIKQGTGSFSLTGASTYTGDTIVQQGTLFVDGSIASANTTVQNGGVIGGHGTIGGNLTNYGIVSPGNSPGTLTISGNYSQPSSGTLKIEIAGFAPAQHDLLAVGGNAALAGNLQLIQLNGFQFTQVGQKVIFLTATGGVTGKFATITNPFATGTMIGAEVVYSSNSVSIETVQESFVTLVKTVAKANPSSVPWETQNQSAVANALDRSLLDSRNAPLLRRLDNEPLEKVLGDLDRLAPDELTSIYQVAVSQSKVQTFNLQRRLEEVRAGASGFSASGYAMNNRSRSADGPGGPAGDTAPDGKDTKLTMAPPSDNRWGVFVTGSGEWANVGDTSNALGYTLTSAGFTLGADFKATDHLILGLGGGYDHSDADLTSGGRIRADDGKFHLYGSYFTGGYYSDVAVQGGYNSYLTHRAALEGFGNGYTTGGELNVLYGTGYDWKQDGLQFGPFANFEYTYLGVGSFTERGSLAPLSFPNQHQESIRSTVGAKASYDWKIGNAIIRPEVRAAWQHEYGDATFGFDSRFASGAGPDFLVHGPATGRDSLIINAGFAIQWSDRFSTYVYYDGELLRTNYEANSVSAGCSLEF